MAKYKSIGQRLKSARRPDTIAEVVADWSSAWEKEQMTIVRDLDRAIAAMDHGALVSAAGQLHGVTERRFRGLDTVLQRLLDVSIRAGGDGGNNS